MPALADVKLSSILTGIRKTTSATVGVDTTMSPEGWKPGNVASWVDRSGGVPLGFKRLTFQFRPPAREARENRMYKVSTKLYFPVLETIDPAVGIFGPKLAYELQAHLDVLIPERCTAAERLIMWSLLGSLTSETVNASDDVPTDLVGSPTRSAVINLEDVF